MERVIIVASSLGALHEEIFDETKKMLRERKDHNKDKQVIALLCNRLVREAVG
jgi:hypothetical protein